MLIDDFVFSLKQNKRYTDKLVSERIFPEQEAEYVDFPKYIDGIMKVVLHEFGINRLYKHQAEAIQSIFEGSNVVLSTGIASGKSLVYQLPILQMLRINPESRALLIFPTKALAQDQMHKMTILTETLYRYLKKNLSQEKRKDIGNYQNYPIQDKFHDSSFLANLSILDNSDLQYSKQEKAELLIKETHLLNNNSENKSYKNKTLYKKFLLGVYDGDTPSELRQTLRKNAQVIFSNPDMLHLAILPHHTMWNIFFANLKYIVIDEVHIYRGVFGSHLANVLRRLKRIATFYKSNLQFICTSATLSNAVEFVQALLEEPVILIDKDTSPHGKRYFHIINPPMINYELGIRKNNNIETVQLAADFLKTGAQGLLFTISRRSTELLYRYLQDKAKHNNIIYSYRSGYLPEDRRSIEKELRDGKANIVISTNALELGIDIGSLDAVFLNGYPGSIAATRQQAGRAGRKGNPSFAALIADSGTLDQYICQHPEYLFEQSPEQALLDADNPEILRQHLQCAIFELALIENSNFGKLSFEELQPHLSYLLSEGLIRRIGNRYTGQINTYPANNVSLRNAPGQFTIIQNDQLLGIVDEYSALWMTHPEAIYLHQGDTYIVTKLDLEKKRVELEPIKSNYYTQANRQTQIELTGLITFNDIVGGRKHFGKVTVTSQIVGYKKLRWVTQELIGYGELDLPPSTLQTVAWWLALNPETIKRIKEKGLWRNEANDYGAGWGELQNLIRMRDNYRCQHCGIPETDRKHDVHHRIPFRKFDKPDQANHPDNLVTLCARCHRLAEQQVHIQSGLAATAYLIGNIAPFFLMCDLKDIGIHSEDESPLAGGLPIILVYDMVAGGIGLSKKLYELTHIVVKEAYNLVSNCPCKEGCPACTGPVAENGLGAKEHALAILSELLAPSISY